MVLCEAEWALNWAQKHFHFQRSETVSNHPWAKTIKLEGNSASAFLKLIPYSATPSDSKLPAISSAFPTTTPQLIGYESNNGVFLFRDFGGEEIGRRYSSRTKTETLNLYGEMQALAVNNTDLLGNLPTIDCATQLTDLLSFFNEVSETPNLIGTASASHFLGDRRTVQYREILLASSPVFERLFASADDTPRTINHCDLRSRNVARTMSGDLTIFDWDEAVSGAPGFSLHALFSGGFRPIQAMVTKSDESNSTVQEDSKALDSYLSALCTGGSYELGSMHKTLPATIAAGTMRYITSFGQYPVSSERSKSSIARNIRRRLSDLMDVASLLAKGDKGLAKPLINAFEDNGRFERAERLAESIGRETRTFVSKPNDPVKNSRHSWMENELSQYENPSVFPEVNLDAANRPTGFSIQDVCDLGCTLFRRHGALMIRNALDEKILQQCKMEFMSHFTDYQREMEKNEALRVGDKRYMVSPQFEGALANPEVFAPQGALSILQELLGKEAILGSVTSVVSLPGSREQSLHRDNAALFKETASVDTPSFSIAMIIPLVSLDKINGATRIIKGTHRSKSESNASKAPQQTDVPLGSCYLMDCRLQHQGMANNSDAPRPILSLVYQRPWYRDYQNFNQQSPIKISRTVFDSLPENVRPLIQWAV